MRVHAAGPDPEADAALPHEIGHVTLGRVTGFEPREVDVLGRRNEPSARGRRDRNPCPPA